MKKKVRKKKVTNKPITAKKELPTIIPNYFKGMYQERQRPVTKRYLIALGEDFHTCIKQDYDCLSMAYFFNQVGIHLQQARTWAKKHPEFRAYYEMGKQLLADKRERRMGIYYDANPAVYMYTQPFYCEVADETRTKNAEIKQKPEDKPVNITVQMPDITKIEDKK